MKKCKVTLVGSGKIAKEYLRVLKSLSNYFDVKFVITRKKENFIKLCKNYKGISHIKNIEELKKKSKFYDLIIIAINELAILKLYCQILEINKLILLEKPLGLDFKESKKIFKAALFRNKVFVAYNRRNYESVSSLKRSIIKAKEYNINFIQDCQEPKILKKNKHHSKVIKNLSYVNSIHQVDLVNFLSRAEIKNIKIIYKNKNFLFSRITFSSNDVTYFFSRWDIGGRMFVNSIIDNNFFKLKPIEVLYKNKFLKNKIISKDNFKPGFQNQLLEIHRVFIKKKIKYLPTINTAFNSVCLLKKIYGF